MVVCSATRAVGSSKDGVDVEFDRFVVAEYVDGVVRRFDYFKAEDLDQARARFDEVGNVALETSRRQIAAALALDWDGVLATTSPDYRYIDRRTGLGHEYAGTDTLLQTYKMAAEFGVDHVDIQAIATRGRRLALYRMLFSGNGFEMETLCVQQTDEQGCLLIGVFYDPSAQDEALAELERPRRSVRRAHAQPAAKRRLPGKSFLASDSLISATSGAPARSRSSSSRPRRSGMPIISM